MAHNRQPDLKPNYSASSDDEEEEEEASGSEDEQTSDSGSEEVSDSDSEPKQKQEPKKPVIAPRQPASKPQAPDLSSSETEESGSDTDSDSQPKKSAVADPNIKPISSKPMEPEEGTNLDSKSAKKSGSKASSTPPPAKAKRPPPAPANEKDVKKAKKSATTDDDSKKQLFQRLWSEDDEIVVLKGMIDYKTEKNGENPVADMGAFHEFIKKSLHVDVSRAQLVDKVRRLKKKYVNNASREKNGKDRSFSKSHEQKGYDLSKLIWGSSSSSHNSGTEGNKKNQTQKNGGSKATAASTSTAAVAVVKTNGVDEKKGLTMEVEKNMDVSRFVQYGRMSYSPVMEEEIMKAGLELVEGSKRGELKEKWDKLKMQELQLYVQRMDLIKEQAAIVFEAMNSSGN